MSFGPIQFGGLASGLDTQAIISAILSVEARTVRNLESEKSTFKERLDLVGTFEGLVEDFQKKVQELRSDDKFFAYALTEGTEGVASFTLGSGATPGSHELEVLQLAQADRHAFAVQTDDTASLGTGTVSFTYDGVDYDVTVAEGSDSLTGIAASINSQAGDAVNASVVNTGTEASPAYRLVVAGNDTGEDFAFDVTTDIAGLGATEELTIASNAIVNVDGLEVQRSTNLFDGVLPGITFTAQQARSGEEGAFTGGTTSFNVERDVDGIKENVRSLVDSYNKVVDFVNDQSSFSEEGGPGGALFGDSLLGTVTRSLRTALFSLDVGEEGAEDNGYETLGLVGVELESGGRLSIDETTFDEKVGANLDAFANLFLKEDAGLLDQVDVAIDGLLKSTTNVLGDSIDGVFDARREALDTNIDRLDDDIEKNETRLERLEESLVLRFARLEELIGRLQSQAGFLGG